MIQTFFDSGVLIAAARSVGPDQEPALQFLEDPNRSFLTSPFVHLEVLPKAIFYKKRWSGRSTRDTLGTRPGTGMWRGLKQSRKRKRPRRASEQWTLSTWLPLACLARTNSSPPRS